MSSDLESALNGLVLNNYASIVILTVVVYDYILTLPSEIKYIWCKPWTWVSTLFLFVRYLGLYCACVTSLIGSTFIPGPEMVNVGIFSIFRTVLIMGCYWGYTLFIAAADLVMVLRVHAMWGRSRAIFCMLLLFYATEVIFQFVTTGIFDNLHTYLSVKTAQLGGFTICYTVYNPLPSFLRYSNVEPPIFDLLLLILALVPTVKQSVGMYRVTKHWQPNRYMILLAREGVLYLFMNLLNNITNMMGKIVSNQLNATWLFFLSVAGVISLYPIMPRFIISIRELYDNDVRGRWEGIDSGFGVSSRPPDDSWDDPEGRSVTISMDTATDVTQVQSAEGDEEMRFEASRDYVRD